MTKIRKLIRAQITALGDDEVEVVMSTSALARDGHVLLPQGCQLENYRANQIVLWSHDPDAPIGNAEDITVSNDQITARIRFAPEGISAKADEIRGLMKAGVIRAVSVGFDPIEGEPIDARKPRAGQRFTSWELLELSAVSVPSDVGATVTNRSNGDDSMADITDGQGAGTTSPAKPASMNRSVRTNNARVAISFGERGLYQVAQLCYMFESLGYQVDSAKYEAAIEGDSSKVPAMLAGVLHDLGDTLLAMTQEEIAEALAGYDEEPEDDAGDDALAAEERQHIRAASAAGVRQFRRGLAHAKVRAGKKLSTEAVRCLREAKDLHEEAMGLHRSAMRKHKDGIAAIDDMLDRSGATEDESDPAATTEDDGDKPARSAAPGEESPNDYRKRQADLQSLTIS